MTTLRASVGGWAWCCTALGRLRLALVGFLLVAWVDSMRAEPPKRVLLHEFRDGDLLVCAEYTSTAAPREPNRSCKSAADVRAWILRDAKDDCH